MRWLPPMESPSPSPVTTHTWVSGLEHLMPVATVGVSIHGGAAAALPRGADGIVRELGTRRVNSHRMPRDFGGQMHAHYGLDHTLYTLVLDRSLRGRVLYDATARTPAIVHDVRLLLQAH